MRWALLGVFVILCLAVSAGETGAQVKKKPRPPVKPPAKLPALAFDAKFVKMEETRGMATKLFYAASEEDSKKLGFKAGDHPVTRATKFVFVEEAGEKTLDQKTVLADAEAKKHLAADKAIRVQTTATEIEVIRFGPGLKPEGIKRVR